MYRKKALRFLEDIKIELKEISWPTHRATLGITVKVLTSITTSAIVFGALDFLCSKIIYHLLTSL